MQKSLGYVTWRQILYKFRLISCSEIFTVLLQNINNLNSAKKKKKSKKYFIRQKEIA